MAPILAGLHRCNKGKDLVPVGISASSAGGVDPAPAARAAVRPRARRWKFMGNLWAEYRVWSSRAPPARQLELSAKIRPVVAPEYLPAVPEPSRPGAEYHPGAGRGSRARAVPELGPPFGPPSSSGRARPRALGSGAREAAPGRPVSLYHPPDDPPVDDPVTLERTRRARHPATRLRTSGAASLPALAMGVAELGHPEVGPPRRSGRRRFGRGVGACHAYPAQRLRDGVRPLMGVPRMPRGSSHELTPCVGGGGGVAVGSNPEECPEFPIFRACVVVSDGGVDTPPPCSPHPERRLENPHIARTRPATGVRPVLTIPAHRHVGAEPERGVGFHVGAEYPRLQHASGFPVLRTASE